MTDPRHVPLICPWCGMTLGPNTFTTGALVFCSGKCARYFATAPVTSSATFFEDARRQFGPWTPDLARPRPGAWAIDCGEHAHRCHGRCLTHTAPGPTLDGAMLGWSRARAMRRLGLPHPWACAKCVTRDKSNPWPCTVCGNGGNPRPSGTFGG